MKSRASQVWVLLITITHYYQSVTSQKHASSDKIYFNNVNTSIGITKVCAAAMSMLGKLYFNQS